MAEIADVWIGDTLNVSFMNGQGVMIPVSAKDNAGLYRKITSMKTPSPPRTDGANVYWRDGPAITLAEIMAMVEE
jgi:hypothetical protein